MSPCFGDMGTDPPVWKAPPPGKQAIGIYMAYENVSHTPAAPPIICGRDGQGPLMFDSRMSVTLLELSTTAKAEADKA